MEEKIPTGDMVNIVFATTIVVSGHGEAVVFGTGMNTKVRKNSHNDYKWWSARNTTSQKIAEKFGKRLGLAALGICFLIFVIGLFKKIPPIEMFMTSVGLAVAAIPEGLPAIVTIMLSIGVTKMAKKNSIIRKLPAVETLGSSNIICSDKTGTLTENKMQVVDTFSNNDKLTLRLATMCTDCNIFYDNNNTQIDGEPTEKAIVEAAIRVRRK